MLSALRSSEGLEMSLKPKLTLDLPLEKEEIVERPRRNPNRVD
jgi:hypothetical protein